MYVPPKFTVTTDDAWKLVEEAGAGFLVHNGAEGFKSVFTPVHVGSDRRVVTAHLAKANDWWKSLNDGDDVMALFLVASSYVSPSYYPSRFENPAHVPTWNYQSVEIKGKVTLHHDADWLRRQVNLVTDHFEKDREPQWHVADSDHAHIERLLGAIVGVEIAVTEITAAAKLSQNRLDIDRESVRDNLAQGTLRERWTARKMGYDE